MSDAGIGAGIEFMPKRACFWQRSQLGAVARGGSFFPSGYRSVLLDLFQASEEGLVGEVVQLFAAKIIAPPFHVADVQFSFASREQRLLQERDVFVEQLLLQIFCSGGNNHALAGTDDRQEISEGLSGSGSSFNDQMTALFDRLLNSLGHLQLSATKFIRRMKLCQDPAGREKLVQRNIVAARFGRSCGRR